MKANSIVAATIGILVVAAIVFAAVSIYLLQAPPAAPVPPPPSGPTAVIYLEAHNIEFVNATTAAKVSTITVPANATVVVHFTNNDAGIPHNFAVYTSSAATTSIFVGTVITGVSSTTYHFTAPSTAGTYFFRCDIHPTIMFGNFVVT